MKSSWMKSYTCLFVVACAGTTAEAACATAVPVGKYVSVAGSADDCATTPITFADFLVAGDGQYYNGVGTVGTVSTTGGTLGSTSTAAACTTAEAGKFLSGACVVGSVLVAGSDATFTAFTTTVPDNHYASAAGTATADVTFTPFTNTVPANHFAATSGVAGTVAAAGTVTLAADVGFTPFTTTGWAGKWATTAGQAGSVTAAGVVTAGTDIVYTAFVAGPPADKFAATAGVPGKAYADGTISTGADGIAAGAATVFTSFLTAVPAGYYAATAGVPGVAAVDGTLTTQGAQTTGAMCHVIALATEQTETSACVPGAAAAGGWITAGTDQIWTGCADVDTTKYTTVVGTGAQCATTQATTVDCALSEANKFLSGACVPGSGLVAGSDTVFTAFTNTVPANMYASADGTATADVTFTPFSTTMANSFATTSGTAGTVAADGTVTGAADVGFMPFTTTGWAGKWATVAGTAGSVTAAGVVTAGTDIVYTDAAAVPARSYSSVAMESGAANADGTITAGAANAVAACTTTVAEGKYAWASCVAENPGVDGTVVPGTIGTDTVFGYFTNASPAVASYTTAAGAAGTATAGVAAGGMDVAYSTCTVAITGEQTVANACAWGTVTAAGALTVAGTDTTFTGCTQPAAGKMTARIGAGANCVTMQPTFADCTAVAAGDYVMTACYGGSGLVLGTDTVFKTFNAVPAGSYNSVAGSVGSATVAGGANTVTACSAPALGTYVSTACAAGTAGTTAGTDTVATAFSRAVPAGSFASGAGAAGTATTLGSDVQFTICTVPTADETVVAACVPGTVAADGSIATAGSNTGVRERQLFPTAHVRHEWKELAFTDTCGSPFEVGVALEGWVTWRTDPTFALSGQEQRTRGREGVQGSDICHGTQVVAGCTINAQCHCRGRPTPALAKL
jgi:hypothetical protein